MIIAETNNLWTDQGNMRRWLEILDNPDSHIHEDEFRLLKELVIERLTTIYWKNSGGITTRVERADDQC